LKEEQFFWDIALLDRIALSEIEPLCTLKGNFYPEKDMLLSKQYRTRDDSLKVTSLLSWQ